MTRLVACLAVAVACAPPAERAAADSVRVDSMARARQDSINGARPDYVIDSILPTPEALRRFRASIGGDSATKLTGGSLSIAALVERFATALARRDTAALRGMAVSAREFADLYYTESPYSRPPYRQPPEFAWRLLEVPSRDGLTRLLRELGGKQVAYVSHTCDTNVVHEGKTTRYGACLVTLKDETGMRAPQRYFGSIVARDGQFKFLSYANRN